MGGWNKGILNEIVNKTYNGLKVVSDLGYQKPYPTAKNKYRYCIAVCHCGNSFKLNYESLKSGRTKSCGCIRKKIKTNIERRLYNVFASMKKRCYSKGHKIYSEYGGRGIDICEEWLSDYMSFINWAKDSGYKKGLQIDRKDNDKGYSPENCRWVQGFINTQNTRLISKRNSTGYRGVSFNSNPKKYSSRIYEKTESKFLGYYNSPELAALAFNNYVIENKTEHPLNIVEISKLNKLLKERDVLLHALKNAAPTLKGLLSVASEHEVIDKQIAFEIDSYTQLLKSIEKE